MLVAIYRVGSHIVLPGIDPVKLELNKAGGNGILDLINTFAGGAFNKASIFALGIMPYISASIFMQLMTVLVPKFQKMQKEGDSGSLFPKPEWRNGHCHRSSVRVLFAC